MYRKIFKNQKGKIVSIIKFDKSLGHLFVKISKPPDGSLHEDLTPQDYQVSKIDLGKGSCAVDMKIFEALNKKIVNRV